MDKNNCVLNRLLKTGFLAAVFLLVIFDLMKINLTVVRAIHFGSGGGGASGSWCSYCSDWINSSCGGSGCPANQRLQYKKMQDQSCGDCDPEGRCVDDSSCSKTCNCGSWYDVGCGNGCASTEMRQQQDCYYSDGSGSCGTYYYCSSSSSCGSTTPTCYTSGTSCQSQGGTCGNYTSSNCSGTVKTGLCPSSSNCVCCVPPAGTVPTPTTGPGPTAPPGATPTPTTSSSSCGLSGVAFTKGCGPNKTCGEEICGAGEMCWKQKGARSDGTSCSKSWCEVDSACATPTCSASLSFSPSSTIKTGQSIVASANVTLTNTTVTSVDFSAGDSAFIGVSPTSVTASPYNTHVSGLKSGSTTLTATVTTNPAVANCTTTATVTVESGAWFQTQGGDVHSSGNLSDKIPSTATNLNLSLDLNNYPGIISYKPDSQVSFGQGFSSRNTADYWLAPSEYKGKPYGSFDFFKKKYALQMTTDNFNGTLPAEDGVYYSSTGQTLSGSWALGGNRWVVVIVDGDISIPVDITVPVGSFLTIASSGKINFASSVTKAQGMFVAETIDTSEGTNAFAGEGIFAATNFNLNRDFGDARNNTTPAETFIARPDFLMSSYKNKDQNLWWYFQKWQELAP